MGPPHGFGALQVELNPRTQGATPADQLAKMFNWKLNVAAAKALNAGKAVEAQTFYWDQYIQWLGFVLDNNGAPTIPGPYSEFTVSSPSQCTFVDPSDVSGVPGSRSYIDAMTIKKYNGGVSYLRWVNDPLRGIGWAAAPTAFASVPAPPKCQKYVKRACTLSSVDTILPLIDGGCDKPYNYEWVSTFLLP